MFIYNLTFSQALDPPLVMSESIDCEWDLRNAIIAHNSEEALHLLTLINCPRKVKYYHNNCSILHEAAIYGMLDIVQVLINDYQCDPHCVDNNGDTPLHNASIRGHLKIVKYLITECHCNPLSKNNDEYTPLDEVKTWKH